MPTVKNILSECDRPIPSVGPDATVLEAAHLMNQFKVMALVVCESEKCVGIFTERDLLRCFASSPQDLSRAAVADVMTRELLVCAPETDIVEARRIMAMRRIHHLPVIGDNDKLVGMVSLIDLNAHDFKDQKMEIDYLKNYIYGRN